MGSGHDPVFRNEGSTTEPGIINKQGNNPGELVLCGLVTSHNFVQGWGSCNTFCYYIFKKGPAVHQILINFNHGGGHCNKRGKPSPVFNIRGGLTRNPRGLEALRKLLFLLIPSPFFVFLKRSRAHLFYNCAKPVLFITDKLCDLGIQETLLL